MNPRRSLSISQDITRLVPLAQRLARRAGAAGVTWADVRLIAEAKGHLTPASRTWMAQLWRVMPRAGLVCRPHTYRRSAVVRSHRNLQAVWVHREYAGRRKTREGGRDPSRIL